MRNLCRCCGSNLSRCLPLFRIFFHWRRSCSAATAANRRCRSMPAASSGLRVQSPVSIHAAVSRARLQKRRLSTAVRARASASSRFPRSSCETSAVPGASRSQSATCSSKTSNSRAGPSSPVIHLSSLFKASVCGSANISENSEIAARNRRSATPHLVQGFRVAAEHQGLISNEMMQARPGDDLEGALHVGFGSQRDRHGFNRRGCLGGEKRIAAISLALDCELHRHFVRQHLRQLEKICSLPPLELQLHFTQRGGFLTRFDLPLVNAELDLALAALDLEKLSLNVRFEHGLQSATQLFVQQARERRLTRCVEIGLCRGDVVFPFAASKQSRVSVVFLLDGLHVTAADASHPQR